MKTGACIIIALGIVLVGVFALVVALAPVLPVPENPPVISEPQWDNPQTRALAVRACFDCHSNQTVWPWYTRSLAASWLVKMDVNEGRQKLNFSAWGRGEEQESEEMGEVLFEGEMPPIQYLLMHPEARLSDSEKTQLADGFSRLR